MVNVRVLASSSKGNCYYIAGDNYTILIECGIPWRKIQVGTDFKTSELAGVLVSHEHKDHSLSIKDAMRAGIKCYMSQGTANELQLSEHELCIVKSLQQFKAGNLIILPFDVQHDATEPLGFLIADKMKNKILFATDTCYIKYNFKGLTHILIECNHAEDILRNNVANKTIPRAMKNRVMRTHFSLERVKNFLRANDLSQVQEIWLLHLSDSNSDAARFKKEVQGITGKPTYIAEE